MSTRSSIALSCSCCRRSFRVLVGTREFCCQHCGYWTLISTDGRAVGLYDDSLGIPRSPGVTGLCGKPETMRAVM